MRSTPDEDALLRVPHHQRHALSPENDRDAGSDSTPSTTVPNTPSPAPMDGFGLDAGPSTCLPSWSVSSDHQLGHASQIDDPSDRVFPIRSVVSVDTSTPDGPRLRRVSLSDNAYVTTSGPVAANAAATGRSHSAVHSTNKVINRVTSPPLMRSRQRRMHTMSGSISSVQADAERHGNVLPLPLTLDDSSDESIDMAPESCDIAPSISSAGRKSFADMPQSLYTQRFKHVETEEGHAVITGQDGKLQRCEDEPIRSPGAIQGFGLMVALQEEDDGRFEVRYVSENSKRLIGYSPRELFQLSSFMDILTEEQSENLLDHIDFIRDEDADPAINGPEVFSLYVRHPHDRRSTKLWCAIHIAPGRPELVICEFELDDDQEYPLRPPGEDFPDLPEDTLNANPTTEELTESTEILSKPLRVLRSARRKRGEAGAMQVFDIMGQVQEQLANAPNLEIFLKILVGIVKELTGFHRVMIYQFDSACNGKVVTELVDPQQTRDLYKGLHFPATDIPKQARELYKINKVRILYDRDLDTARIVCKSMADLENPLDMTHAYLRAMSPIHLKYLGNMAVRSSMSISINAFGDLWGLIACHSYGPKGMRVSFPIRKMCRLVGETASRNIERLSYASRLQARKLINTVPTNRNPSGYIIASSEDLLKLFDADFGMLSIREETKILGKIEQAQEALAMLEYLRLRKFISVVMTQDIKVDFPDLRYPPGFKVIAGLLYVPLSAGGSDFIVFFRRGQISEVSWAGNPYDKVIREGTSAYLEPRESFKAWYETVVGKSREWSEEQVETAAVLCLVYGKFIEVWRQKEAALQNSRLTRLLLANSAHEVRTPLNAIINYLEIALEGSLDQETRDNLARSHSASKSLIYVINDLLDLTKTEEGQELIKDEVFDLPACIREATEQFKNDAKRKGIEYQVIEYPGLPRLVHGDQRRVRQAVANITANAVEHTTEGFVKVELYVAEVQDRRVRVEIVVQDSGSGMSNTQLDNLFTDLEQVNFDGDDGDSGFIAGALVGAGEDKGADKKPEKARTLGLGLAVVARVLRNMDGQLRLKSEEGKGSRFVIQLPFDLPEEDSTAGDGREKAGTVSVVSGTGGGSTAGGGRFAGSGAASVSSAERPNSQDGEVMLVDRGSVSSPAAGIIKDKDHTNSTAISRRRSFDEKQSITSYHTTASRGSLASWASRGSMSSTVSNADRLIDAIQMPLTLGEPEPETVARQRRSSGGAYFHHPSSSVPSYPHHHPHQHQSHPDLREPTAGSASPNSRRPGGVRRPAGPSRSVSSPSHHKRNSTSAGEVVGAAQAAAPVTGVQYLTDTKVPIKPVKIPDESVAPKNETVPFDDVITETDNGKDKDNKVIDPSTPISKSPPTVAPTVTVKKPGNVDVSRSAAAASRGIPADGKPRVLVAEDDPINVKVLRKRLEKAGHHVHHSLNGEECAMVYREKPGDFDVVLMDMQMPIVDGLTSTKMIRAFEEEQKATHRIPIIAVSASLVERDKDMYTGAGFDGWILKPIDFRRLETLLKGIVDAQTREESLYVPGQWEKGGWFSRSRLGSGSGGGSRTQSSSVDQLSQAASSQGGSPGGPGGVGLGVELKGVERSFGTDGFASDVEFQAKPQPYSQDDGRIGSALENMEKMVNMAGSILAPSKCATTIWMDEKSVPDITSSRSTGTATKANKQHKQAL